MTFCVGRALTDLDGDSIVDLAFTSNNPNTCLNGVSILRNNGNGTFSSMGTGSVSSCAPTVFAVTSGDLNHDNRIDVVFASGTQVVVLLSSAAVGFLQTTYPIPQANTGRITHADFNLDGMEELVLTGAHTTILDGGCPDPVISAPRLVAIRDVPHDQGGRVFVAWNRSPLDAFGARRVSGYTVWRRIAIDESVAPGTTNAGVDGTPTQSAIKMLIDEETHQTSFWEALATLPAQYLPSYAFTAETTRDSLPASNPYTAFFVSALTDDPFVFFESNVDSGYSVDNLAPTVPKGIRGVLIPETGDLVIHWRRSPELDLHYYNVYRSNVPGFEASPVNLIASTPDTVWVDSNFTGSTFYRISAVDIHGNESRPPVPVGVENSGTFTTRLFPPFDSSNGAVRIRYDLAISGTPTSVQIFSASGRLIRVLDQKTNGPGHYVAAWDRRDHRGSPVARGLYLVRLQAGPVEDSHKLVLLRQP